MNVLKGLIDTRSKEKAKFPVVCIPKAHLDEIKRLGAFRQVITEVRRLMAEGGIDYRMEISSWMKDGALYHQNFIAYRK